MKVDIKKVIGWSIILTVVTIFYYANIINVINYPNDSDDSHTILSLSAFGLFLGVMIWALTAINN